MASRPPVTRANLGIVAIVLAAVAVGVFAVTWMNRSGREASPTGTSDVSDDQIAAYRTIDPALIRYKPGIEFPTGFSQARAVAVGPFESSGFRVQGSGSRVQDAASSTADVQPSTLNPQPSPIYVAGDRAIRVFGPNGKLLREISLDLQPRCLAVGGRNHVEPGRIYVAAADHVEVLDAAGQPLAAWESLGPRALLTSIAVGEDDVFVADAGDAIVLRYDTSGRLVRRIGAKDSHGAARAFAIPSPFFDVAVGPDKLLYVVNPAALRIEGYSFDGDLERFWGEAGPTIEGFFGCCNPANFAIFADGRFVTAEKGLLRVKIYDADGRFDCVVAGPDELDRPGANAGGTLWDHEFKAVDVAADRSGRVLVLDLAKGGVRVFEPLTTEKAMEK